MEFGKPTKKLVDENAYTGLDIMLNNLKTALSYNADILKRLISAVETTNALAKNGYVDTKHFSINVVGVLSILSAIYKNTGKCIVGSFKDNRIIFCVVDSGVMTGKSEKVNADIVSTYAEVVIRITNLPRTFVSYGKKDVKDMCGDYQDVISVIVW